MQKKNFRYLPVSPGAETWGLVVTGAGHARTPPGSAYPPERHPNDHMFDWERGRTLGAFQLLCISEGSGELESNLQPPQKIKADSAFLLAPGEWHRYRPNPKTGWTECWIEFQGTAPAALYREGQLGEAMVPRLGAAAAGLPGALNAVFQRIVHALPRVDPEASALAMQALSIWHQLGQPRPGDTELNDALATAVQILEQEFRTPIDLEELAARVGMTYSNFRRLFQKHTGFAPWKYVQNLRLAYARRQLGISPDSIESLANELGFSSPFHLSAAFRKAFGVSPRQWRSGQPPSSFATDAKSPPPPASR